MIPGSDTTHLTPVAGGHAGAWLRALRPAQWIKNGVLFAGVVFGGKLLDPPALAQASLAFVIFCLVSSGFYLINDVVDRQADLRHPIKRRRPVAAGEIPATRALAVGILLVAGGLVCSFSLGAPFLLAVLTYVLLMTAYNLWLKRLVIVDVFTIAAGFVVRAAAGAIAVGVVISPWLLICTMLLALLVAFGKRRHELLTLPSAQHHRRNLEHYTPALLDQCVAITATGTLLAYALYTFDAESAPQDHRLMITIPFVAYGIFRYLFLLYRRGDGGAPESMLVADRPLLLSLGAWAVVIGSLFYVS
ncbi:MAG: decaprenyl-phosphate phosphoribosyltransferase [Thermomicrobiales bacterium]|nr:decaprenyl-phosphate phosphoribosyltransferase [Thermomicrobiales bacterium]